MSTKPPHAGVARRSDEVARALDHHPLELLGLALADRDEVDDDVAAVDRAARGSPASVTSPPTTSQPSFSSSRALSESGCVASTRTGRSLLAQRVDDVRPDEAGAAGDEDHRPFSSKFFQ